MTKKQLSQKEIAQQLACWHVSLSKKDHVELVNDKVILINHEPLFFYYDNKILPTLRFLMKSESLKKITVDMGAIKFLTNGADIMRPGITAIEEGIEAHDPVVIIDKTHKKPLAVGIVLCNSKDMQNTIKGKVIKNIHYVGDEIWNI